MHHVLAKRVITRRDKERQEVRAGKQTESRFRMNEGKQPYQAIGDDLNGVCDLLCNQRYSNGKNILQG